MPHHVFREISLARTHGEHSVARPHRSCYCYITIPEICYADVDSLAGLSLYQPWGLTRATPSSPRDLAGENSTLLCHTYKVMTLTLVHVT